MCMCVYNGSISADLRCQLRLMMVFPFCRHHSHSPPYWTQLRCRPGGAGILGQVQNCCFSTFWCNWLLPSLPVHAEHPSGSSHWKLGRPSHVRLQFTTLGAGRPADLSRAGSPSHVQCTECQCQLLPSLIRRLVRLRKYQHFGKGRAYPEQLAAVCIALPLSSLWPRRHQHWFSAGRDCCCSSCRRRRHRFVAVSSPCRSCHSPDALSLIAHHNLHCGDQWATLLARRPLRTLIDTDTTHITDSLYFSSFPFLSSPFLSLLCLYADLSPLSLSFSHCRTSGHRTLSTSPNYKYFIARRTNRSRVFSFFFCFLSPSQTAMPFSVIAL